MEIAVEHVSKAFAATAALRDVSLTVRSGELMALLGPSGSGKTTLLRVIAGLEAANGGRVLFGGRDATQLPVQKRRVGFVFQHYALFRHMNVARNIAYGLTVRRGRDRPSAEAIASRVKELLALVQLPGLEGRYPAQLSGGQRQRIALARALAVEPQLLLLDEPFGALDAKVRRELRRWLRDIHERTGVTTIFVTHDQDEALELADRVAVLRDGTIEQVGTPDEVHDLPANAFVMRFIGDTSRIETRAQDGALWRGDVRLSVTPPAGHSGRLGLFVRPWDVRIEDGNGAETLPGLVLGLRRTSTGRRAEVKLIGSDEIVEVDLSPDANLRADAMVGLRVLNGRLFPIEDDAPP